MGPAEAILRHLISEYGAPLQLPVGDNQIAAHISEHTKLAQGTVLGILKGTTERLNENTRNRLATFFNQKAVPQIQPVWFLSSSLQEVVHIWHNGAFLQFKMSFINRSGGNDGPIFYFEGPVLLVGRSAVLFGTNIGPTNDREREYDRARVIMIDHDNAGEDTRDCKIGLMTSTRPRRDNAPCAASTIFIRTQWNAEPQLEDLARTATVIRSLDTTINDDFGVGNGPLVKLFLDNRPNGCKLEAEMQPYENFFGREPERILRLDTDRFATTMHQILSEIISNNEICAPFKKNWGTRPQTAPISSKQ
jgi:hypothetical protein